MWDTCRQSSSLCICLIWNQFWYSVAKQKGIVRKIVANLSSLVLDLCKTDDCTYTSTLPIMVTIASMILTLYINFLEYLFYIGIYILYFYFLNMCEPITVDSMHRIKLSHKAKKKSDTSASIFVTTSFSTPVRIYKVDQSRQSVSYLRLWVWGLNLKLKTSNIPRLGGCGPLWGMHGGLICIVFCVYLSLQYRSIGGDGQWLSFFAWRLYILISSRISLNELPPALIHLAPSPQ